MKRSLRTSLLAILFIPVLIIASPVVLWAGSSPVPAIVAASAILVEQETGTVLYRNQASIRMFPASTTKILTALLALENLDLNQRVTVGREIERIRSDASDANLREGDRLSVQDLIRALMLPSGNDAAYTLAVQTARKKSGDPGMVVSECISYFTNLMNERALELGAKGSNFVNPDGYHDENHYSTAYDLSLIAREAMKNRFFREVVKTQEYTPNKILSELKGMVGKRKTLPWVNKNELIRKESPFYYEYATGLKTGHTSQAGYCLVSSASRNGTDLIAVVLKEEKEEARWKDSRKLLEYGFKTWRKPVERQKKSEPAQSQVAVESRLAALASIPEVRWAFGILAFFPVMAILLRMKRRMSRRA